MIRPQRGSYTIAVSKRKTRIPTSVYIAFGLSVPTDCE